MIRSIAAAFTAAWSIFGVQSGYGQPPSEVGKIYWTNSASGIHRSSLDGSNVERLVTPDLRAPDKIALDVAGGKIYWTDIEMAGIHQSDLDGSNTETLVEGYNLSRSRWFWTIDITLDVAGGKIYWTTGISHGDYLSFLVERSDLDGSNVEILFDGLNGIGDSTLDLVRGKVYWTNGYIAWADLGGHDYDAKFIPSSASTSAYSIALDVDGGKMYWTNPGAQTIQRADLNGQNIEETLTVSDGYPQEILLLDVDGGKLYWTNPGTQTIQRADLNGQNAEHFFDLGQLHLTGSLADIALDLDGGKIYWTDSETGDRSDWATGTIQRADLDGQNREVLFDPIVRRPHGIALDKDKMYWSDSKSGSIQRANLNGSGMEVLVTGLDEPMGIALTAGRKIYWADSGTGKIQAANRDGSNVKDILTGLSYPRDIALDVVRDKMYWREFYFKERVEHTIQRADLDGSNVEAVVPKLASTSYGGDVALDELAGKLYWIYPDGKAIQRADLDGSNIEDIATIPQGAWNYYTAFALDPIGNKLYWSILYETNKVGGWGVMVWAEEIFRSNLDGSNVEQIGKVPIGSPTDIALYIPHPTSISTPSTTPAIPTTSGLDPNFPNPFNAHTQIAYRLAAPGPVRLAIYNVLGQPVRTLVNQFQPAGFYQVPWDARDQQGTALAAGVYLTRLHHPDGTQTRRLLYLK